MATSCDITKGRLAKCKNSVGGLFKLFFLNWDTGDVIITDGVTEEITDINDGEGVPGAVTFYEWDIKGASSLTETPTVSVDNGTAFWEQVLTAVFKKLDAETRKEIKLMTYGLMRVAVQDNNGNTLLIGEQFGVDVSGGSIATGTNMEDLSGYTLVQTGREPEPAKFIQGSTLDDPFGGLTTPPTIVGGA